MRAVARAVFARYPLVAFAAVVGRWILWAVAGYPTFLAVCGLGYLFGMGLELTVAGAVLAEAALSAGAKFGSSSTAQLYVGWRRACSFRRRWPSTYLRLVPMAERLHPAVLSRNFYSSPNGFRPVLAGPRVAVIPARFSPRSISWQLWGTDDCSLPKLVERLERLSTSDGGAANVEVRQQRGPTGNWLITLAFGPAAPEVANARGPRYRTNGMADQDRPNGSAGQRIRDHENDNGVESQSVDSQSVESQSVENRDSTNDGCKTRRDVDDEEW